MNVDFEMNNATVAARVRGRLVKAQSVLDIQVLKDSNVYVPVDSHTLERSGTIASGGGEVVWDTPYARIQYHGLNNKSKDQNPNASSKWFEVAKARKLKVWERIANSGYNQ